MGINIKTTYYQLSKCPTNFTLTEDGIAEYEKIYRKTAKKAPFDITEADIQRDMAIVRETKWISGPLGGVAANLWVDFLMNPNYVTYIADADSNVPFTLTRDMLQIVIAKAIWDAIMQEIPQGPIGNNE